MYSVNNGIAKSVSNVMGHACKPAFIKYLKSDLQHEITAHAVRKIRKSSQVSIKSVFLPFLFLFLLAAVQCKVSDKSLLSTSEMGIWMFCTLFNQFYSRLR